MFCHFPCIHCVSKYEQNYNGVCRLIFKIWTLFCFKKHFNLNIFKIIFPCLINNFLKVFTLQYWVEIYILSHIFLSRNHILCGKDETSVDARYIFVGYFFSTIKILETATKMIIILCVYDFNLDIFLISILKFNPSCVYELILSSGISLLRPLAEELCARRV